MADATTGPGAATLVTPVSAVLPAAADNRPLVQLRILTTNAVGQDEWVGVDDIEVEAGEELCAAAGARPPQPPGPVPSPGPWPPSACRPRPRRLPFRHRPRAHPPHGLSLSGRARSRPQGEGPALSRTGRAGASLRFRLSRPAKVEFRVTSVVLPKAHLERTRPGQRESAASPLSGRRGLNRLRFTGRLRGRPLPAGALPADRPSGRLATAWPLPPASIGFRIR